MTTPKQIEQSAYKFRQHIRAKAGLKCDWVKASENMKEFYRELARRQLGVEE